MSTAPKKSEFLKKVDGLVIKALKEAVARNRKLGTPVYVTRNGKIIDIAKENPNH